MIPVSNKTRIEYDLYEEVGDDSVDSEELYCCSFGVDEEEEDEGQHEGQHVEVGPIRPYRFEPLTALPPLRHGVAENEPPESQSQPRLGIDASAW